MMNFQLPPTVAMRSARRCPCVNVVCNSSSGFRERISCCLRLSRTSLSRTVNSPFSASSSDWTYLWRNFWRSSEHIHPSSDHLPTSAWINSASTGRTRTPGCNVESWSLPHIWQIRRFSEFIFHVSKILMFDSRFKKIWVRGNRQRHSSGLTGTYYWRTDACIFIIVLKQACNRTQMLSGSHLEILSHAALLS